MVRRTPDPSLLSPRYMAHLDAPKQYVCKHCKVPVIGPHDHSAKLGWEHKRGCPRRRRGK